jgi:hypothetical protein
MSKKSRAALIADINSRIYPNNVGAVTPTVLNTILTDIVDSDYNQSTDFDIVNPGFYSDQRAYKQDDLVIYDNYPGSVGYAILLAAVGDIGPESFNFEHWYQVYASTLGAGSITFTGAISNITSTNLAPLKLLSSDSNGKIVSSGITSSTFNNTMISLSNTSQWRIPIQSGTAGTYITSASFSYNGSTNILNAPTLQTSLINLNSSKILESSGKLVISAPNGLGSSTTAVNFTSITASNPLNINVTSGITQLITNNPTTGGIQLGTSFVAKGVSGSGYIQLLGATATPSGVSDGSIWFDNVNSLTRVKGVLKPDFLLVQQSTGGLVAPILLYANSNALEAFIMPESTTYVSNETIGSIRNDGTYGALSQVKGTAGGKIVTYLPGLIYSSYTFKVISNTSTETTIFDSVSPVGTRTLPPNYLTTYGFKKWRVNFRARMQTKATSAGTLLISSKIGTATCATASYTLPNNADGSFVGSVNFSLQTGGTAVYSDGYFMYESVTGTTNHYFLPVNSFANGFDTTIACAFDLTLKFSVANANNSITIVSSEIVEVL